MWLSFRSHKGTCLAMYSNALAYEPFPDLKAARSFSGGVGWSVSNSSAWIFFAVNQRNIVLSITTHKVLNAFNSWHLSAATRFLVFGPFIATQLYSTRRRVASAGRYRHFVDATQLHSTSRRPVELRRYRHPHWVTTFRTELNCVGSL